jgi:hypothetical protein
MRRKTTAFLAVAALCCVVAGVRAEDEPHPPELAAAAETPDETRLEELWSRRSDPGRLLRLAR